ncbi:MAG: carbon-nitrogen hydrolase family protein [Pseudomonadales bacterium]
MVSTVEKPNILRLLLAQMCSSDRHIDNIAKVSALACAAQAQGCQLLALPEASGLIDASAELARDQIVEVRQDPFIQHCQQLAARYQLWIHTGSTPVKGPQKWLNQSQCIDKSGAVRCYYSKVHLFDAVLEGQAPIGESERYSPGEQAVLQRTPWGNWGMSICYDVRFPQLYRDYALAGADVVFVPAAFTLKTGQAHWETLLRARAIENGLWIVAAAQVGTHARGRRSWGESMVINPWGEVVARLDTQTEQSEVVEINLAEVAQARRQIPSLQHARDYTLSISE